MATPASSAENSSAGAGLSPERIMQMSWAYAPPLILEAAIRHRVFDVLDSGPKTLAEVSRETGASERGLTAILNALIGFELLEKRDGKYALTPESAAFLVTTKPSFQGGLLKHISRQVIPAWLNLTEIVAKGTPSAAVNQQQKGAEFFEKFVNDIFPMSYPAAQDLAQHLRLDSRSGPANVLDLAAGSGVWGIALAQSAPNVRVTAVDWPGVIHVTRANAQKFGLADRFSFREGDLQEADFGSGYQVATLGHILHSEGERRSRALLKKTFDALAPGGIVSIAEFLVNADRTGPATGLIFAVNMLVNTDEGGTYSFEEIAGWLGEAGFIDARTLTGRGPSPLVLATKP